MSTDNHFIFPSEYGIFKNNYMRGQNPCNIIENLNILLNNYYAIKTCINAITVANVLIGSNI